VNPRKTKDIEPATGTIDWRQQIEAKVAGLSLILAIALLIISNYSVSYRYVIPV
jgi:hypothetical protein